MARTALLIFSGNAVASLLLLLRNLLIARLISVENYGIAATFAVVMALVEMASFLGLHQQIVQAKDGNDPKFQAALQGFQVLRGIAASCAMFLIAGPIASFLGVPEITWAYQLLSILPFLNSLQHFDIHRLSREMNFAPLILTSTVPTVISVLAVWPLAKAYGDYRVMLYAQFIQMGLLTALSHVVAERSYQIIFDRTIMLRSLAFGWPLLVNGLLMFFVFQGDKLIVGRELGMEMLAIFAMGMTLTLTPTLVISRSAQNFFLPQLSRLSADEAQLHAKGVLTVESVLAMTVIFALGAAIFGPLLVKALLGAKYADLATVLIWFATMQSVRIFKVGPAIIAMAQAQNSNDMYANIARVCVLPVAWYFATRWDNILGLVLIALLGEVFALGVSLHLLKSRCRFPVRRIYRPLGIAALMLVVLCAVSGMPALTENLGFADALLLPLATVLTLVLSYLAFPNLRHGLKVRYRAGFQSSDNIT